MRKNFLKLAACSTLLLVNIKANAVTPRNDWYAGIFLGPSATAASSFDFGQPILKDQMYKFQQALDGSLILC